MSNKGTKMRISNAFLAMKGIGISEDTVRPVLKSLLKTYDKNWELIEADNYGVLADAIFENQEAPVEEPPKKIVNNEVADNSENLVNSEDEAEVHDEPERPFKRTRLKDRESQTSSVHMSNAGVMKNALVLHSAVAENTRVKSPVVMSQSLHKSRGKQPMSLVVYESDDPCQPCDVSSSQQNKPLRIESGPSHVMRIRDRLKGPVSPEVPSKSPTTAALIKPKDEPVIDDIPLLDAPIAVIRPDPSGGGDSSSRDGTVRGTYAPQLSLSQSVCATETADGAASPNELRSKRKRAIVFDECSPNLEIASSPAGEVRIFFSSDLALGRTDFEMPNLQSVVKSVEDKFLKPYLTSDPNLSLMNLMKEMCCSFLQHGTKASTESPRTPDVTPTVDLQRKPSGVDVQGTRDPCFSPLNGSVDSHFNKPFLCPHSKGVDDGSQSNNVAGVAENGTDGGKRGYDTEETNSLSLIVIQQAQPTPEMSRSVHHVVDIAKGQENVSIMLVNQVDDEGPPTFYYIPQNAVFRSAHVDFSLARIGDSNCCSTCFGDCLTSATACACAHETGGAFAYTTDGLVKDELLKECISMKNEANKHHQSFCKECPLEKLKSCDIIEPCKGHVTRKFIKECWWKCGCDKQCGNRVVQRGISRNLEVFMTPEGKGWGLRTLEDLPKGAFICEFVGEVLTTTELADRVLQSQNGEKHLYPVFLDANWSENGVLKDEDALCLDAACFGNVARFINHRCGDPNLVDIPVEVETPDHHYYHLAFFTTREVKAMEELTWDYGVDFNDTDHPIKAFHCQCRSNFCRGIKRYSKFYICGQCDQGPLESDELLL